MHRNNIRKFIDNLRHRCAKNKDRPTQQINSPQSCIHAYELEPRILYSAAPIPVEMADGADVNPLSENNPFEIPDLASFEDHSRAFDQQESDENSLQGLAESFGGESVAAGEYVFIDNSVDDFQWMSEQIQEEYPDANVIILNSNANGIEQISNALSEARHVGAVHFVTHGSDGNVQLGNVSLNQETIGLFTDQIVQWSHSLTLDADLYFYGCGLASTENGTELLESLESITGADLAASDDLTGHHSLGGDWELEYQLGEVSESEAFFSRLHESWMSLLAADLQPEGYNTTENNTVFGNVLANDSTDGFDLSVPPVLNYDANEDTDDFGGWREENGNTLAHFELDPSVTHTYAPTNAPNAIEGAFQFNGAGAFFDDIPSVVAGVDNDDSVSFELWFNPSDAVGQEILFDIGNLQGTSLKLNDSILEFHASDITQIFPDFEYESVTTTVDLSAKIAEDEYNHFVGVLDSSGPGTTMELYINGQRVDIDTNSDFVDWADGTFDGTGLGSSYGATATASFGFDSYEGEIAAFNVYGQALNSTQVQQNFDNAFLAITDYDSVSSGGASVSIDAQGNFIYDPGTTFDYLSQGESVFDTFQYVATDAANNSSIQTVQIEVNGQNDAPILTGPALLANADETSSAFSLDLLDGAVHPEGLPLNVENLTLIGGDAKGISVSGNSLNVDPEAYTDLFAGQSETIQYSYDIVDESGASTDQTATIVISGVDLGAPIVVGGLANLTHEDQTALNIDLLSGATDPDGGTLSVADVNLITGDDTGVTIIGKKFTVDPSAYNSLAVGETETLQYEYNIVDIDGHSVAQTLTLQIQGRNDLPTVTAAINESMTEDDGLRNYNLLKHSGDLDDGDNLEVTNLTLVSGNDVGVTFNAATNSIQIDTSMYESLNSGDTEVIVYNFDITDNQGGTVSQTATFSVNGENDGPVVSTLNVLLNVNEDGPIAQLDLLSNSTDPDASDSLTVENLTLVTGDAKGVSIIGKKLQVDPTLYQELAEGEEMRIRYDYDVVDEQGASAKQRAIVRITGSNDAPIITSTINSAISEDGAATTVVDLLSGTFDIDTSDTLNVKNLTHRTGDDSGVSIVGNTLEVNSAAYQYLSDGEVVSLKYTYEVVDSFGATIEHQAVIEISGTNDNPVVLSATSGSVAEDNGSFKLNLLDNAFDIDASDSLSITNLSQISGDVRGVLLGPNTITVDSNIYDHLSAGETEVLTFVYDVVDDQGGISAGNIASVTITGSNDDPEVLKALNFTTKEDDNLVVDLLAGASDVDSSALSVTAFSQVAGDQSGISVSGNQLIVDPAAYQSLQEGDIEKVVLNYLVVDTDGGKTSQKVSIHINGANDVPQQIEGIDDVGVAEDSSKRVIDLSEHFADFDDTNLDYAVGSVSNPNIVKASIKDGQLTLEFVENQHGNADITVTATDSRGEVITADFEVDIAPVNDRPIVIDKALAIVDEGQATGNLLKNAFDVDSTNLTAQITTLPTNGTVTINPDGTFTFVPNAGFSGTDSFEFVASDGQTVSESGQVFVSVAGSFNVLPEPDPEPTVESVEPVEPEVEIVDPVEEDPPIAGQPESGTVSNPKDSGSGATLPATDKSIPFRNISTSEEAGDGFRKTFSGNLLPSGSGSASSTIYARQVNDLELPALTFSSLTTKTAAVIPEAAVQIITSLNSFSEDLEQATDAVNLSVTTSVVSLSGVSIGVVTWALRSGVLLASMMANLPAWRMVDPLSVLGYANDDFDDDESLMDIVDGNLD